MVDFAERGDTSGPLFVVKGFRGWVTLFDRGFGVVILGGSLVFIVWGALKSPQLALPFVAILPFAILPGFVFDWIARKRGNVQQRRLVYRESANKLLTGRCGVCDYDLLHLEADDKPLGSEQSCTQLTCCPECSATWNLRAWRESYVLDDSPPATLSEPKLAEAQQHAMLHAAVLNGTMGKATRATEQLKLIRTVRKREVIRRLPGAFWGSMNRLWLTNIVAVCGIAGTVAAVAWIEKMQATPAGLPAGALFGPSATVLLLLCFINTHNAITSSYRMLEREALSRGLCAICEEALPSDIVLAHADNCVVCKGCGARRDKGEVSERES
jgi:hypothetical protein